MDACLRRIGGTGRTSRQAGVALHLGQQHVVKFVDVLVTPQVGCSCSRLGGALPFGALLSA